MKNLTLVLLTILILSPLNAQNPETQDSEPEQGQPQQPSEQQIIEMTRNIYYSCIIISRHFLNSGEGVIENLREIASAYADITDKVQKNDAELKVWKRIYLDTIKECINHQTPQGAMDLYGELQSQQFDPRPHFKLIQTVNFENYKNKNANVQFNQEEEAVWGMMQEFEKKIRDQNQQHQDDDEDIDYSRFERPYTQDFSEYEPKLFGVSTKTDSKLTQIIVLLVIFGGFGGIIYLAVAIASKGEEEPVKKKKKVKSN